jgi:hypothetical protein
VGRCVVIVYLQNGIKKVKYAYQESPHSENTASPRSKKEEREREDKQLTKKRTLGVNALERSVAKQFGTSGLNQVLRCTNLTLAPTDSHMNIQAQSCLGEITPAHPSAQECCVQKHTNI